ncbi:MAG: histidine phosphatase family protein [Candidatus Jacksonbacteria bacterium]|nr:histidine phosphatase family protein [Candidatus Jacksonbacteria bacterium]
MVEIVFEAHSTSLDNETGNASGHFDVALSDLGKTQAKELGERRKNEHFDAIFCSDLQRSYKTAEIAFGDKFRIIKDARLRECDYGELTQAKKERVDKEKPLRITEPFPSGESYTDCGVRMKSFLDELKKNYQNKKVLIIGHRATQYGLENSIKGVPMKEVVSAPWSWQPGWEYELK